jgi:hydrogenase/urease accessory protein HupE
MVEPCVMNVSGSPRGEAPRRRTGTAACIAAVLLFSAVTVRAHDPGLSSLDVRVGADRIVAVLSMAAADAKVVTDRGERIDAFAARSIELVLDGAAVSGRIDEQVVEGDAGVRVTVAYPRAAAARVTVRSRALAGLARGHRQLLTVRGAHDEVLAQRMLDMHANALDVDVARATPSSTSALQFVEHGVRHILGGYDHVLFLAALLLGVGRLRSVAITVTAFTAAHSLTLSAVFLGFLHLPSAIVEPLIAVSVVYVGIENLMRGQMESRWKLTFAFGLLHGFGFAGALQDLGIGGSGASIATALASFNAGVEIGQLAIAALLWPLLQRLNTTAAWRLRLAPACSLLIVAAGCYWVVERTLG